MIERPEPKDPAEMLRKHYASIVAPDDPDRPKLVLSNRNRQRLEKIRRRVRELRGQ